ncbi:MAG: sigma-70 family RNA polymerase sigma factor, partial [Eubacterium sp.]|nr:sigma-70 family RNA polymerase sigma factor [Eubacterium sp.]
MERFQNGDKEAKDILIERNLRLVAHIAKKYYSENRENEELISIGIIGLIKALNTYNPKKAKRLVTYASKCIENELLMML